MRIARLHMSRKHLVIAGAATTLAIVLLIALGLGRSSKSKVGYSQTTVSRGEIKVEILSTGVVKPENRLEIKPPISGRVEQVLVDEGQDVKKGQVLVYMSSSERAALLDAARARGGEELARWETFYRPAPILAPIDGTIILRNVEPGQTFTTAEAVLVMSDRLTVKAQVDETDISDISLGQKAAVVLDAYPDMEIQAHVDKIAYDATTVNNVTTYIVDVLPEKTPDVMRSGMTANVRFAITTKPNVLIVPVNAVKVKDSQHFVTVPPANAIGAPIEKEIAVGISDGKNIEVTSGLSEGDVVLVPLIKKAGGSSGSSPFTPFRGPPKR